ncbi:hypothetical protein KY285_025902 [Solanum tuberosum]|nr:hypothetical protein KY285_025902 [Solanum tuberosum]
MFPGVTQYEVLQNVCGNVRDFHGLIVNGCIKHEMVENVIPQFQLMAERVGHFLWEDQTDEDSQLSELDQIDEDKDDQIDEDSQLSELDKDDQTDEDSQLSVLDQIDEDSQLSELDKDDQTDEDSQLSELDEDDQNDRDSRLFKLAHLLLKTVPTEQEVMHICNTNLKASTSAEVGRFTKMLLETSPDILREYLIHLQEHMDFIHHDKLFDLLVHVGALTREVSTLVRDLEEKLRNREGFEEETNLILRKLTGGPADLDVISITGMPGSGKTTLAYKVYNDKSVSSHFDLRAWCTVDQGYDENKLLDKIFNQVSDSDSKLSENIDVADKLRKQLFGKRYLIVLDDVWDTTTWDELTRPFPEVQKGRRIILTTREKEVALHGKLYTASLDLRLLRSEESWELLEKRAFGNESCPDELLDVETEIAENCKGLPLVVDLLLESLLGGKRKRVWLEVVNNLHSFILKNEVEVMKVIEISYDHLPDHLKPCLLHFSSKPKDSATTIYELKAFK